MGFTIHSAVHAARADAHFVIHLHAENGVAVSAQKEGLLPISQHALTVRPHLAYHDYEGIALNLDERQLIVADLGSKSLMLLRNHGALAVGNTPGAAWLGAFYLERACAVQIKALSAGRDRLLEATPAARDEVQAMTERALPGGGMLVWPGSLRLLDRLSPGYDA